MKPIDHTNRALVLFSGGQDSTTCLAWALSHFSHVETIGFHYGQRHAIELEMRPQILQKIRGISPQWQARLGEDHMIDLGVISQLSQTAMTEDIAIQMQANGLPNTFVPGRNLMFMLTAATLGYRRNLNVLVGGMCETDFSGYPDCRDDSMKALQVAINLGLDTRTRLETPLMWIDKAETWALADELGVLDLIRHETLTCYNGVQGDGCGHCPACKLRREGLEKYLEIKAEREKR